MTAPRDESEHANLERLHGCARPHDFKLLHPRGAVSSRARYWCRRCLGEINEHGFLWYRAGLRDGLRVALDAEHRDGDGAP